METMRLDKLISSQSVYSRKEVKQILKQGAVKINGNVVKSAESKVCCDKDTVEIFGKNIFYKKNIYLMLNKPAGYVCSTRDGQSPTVLELIPSDILKTYKNIFPAGRLDKDTEGFVLLTDDGELSHEILSPKKHIPKYYLVKLAKPFKKNYVQQFDEGLTIDGGEQCLPARVCGFEKHENIAFIELYEGKFHQVKRMFAAVENHVEYLYRTQMGNITMHENLGLGAYMEILHNDVENLFKTSDFEAAKASATAFFSSKLINPTI
jgi:16S rRNA pseudouridine516 synthase